ncbi:amidase family protein [Geosporobacter ferrireducens]|uniref:Amidase domain-containing protein n=1 Tax=Geosporobacter ferrireducens TaxID=1424294 RepID=A0A1D8GHK8_9FIRM|nr:amidase family protein [Geosporobacter ferrireducens]AOT70360.1 hypothetical protein Gferi_12620 [Geosporobacter ferrireducens]
MNILQDNLLLQMKKLNKAMLKAKDMENKSVVYFRKEVLEEAVVTLTEDPMASLVLFGVKNTVQIGPALVQRLKGIKGFLFHTVDKMSERGRAIDVDLINPLTGRVMTGSSSGSCVNILRGINDIAIGTDGGGSVLAPAMSTGLFSIMGKGLGLKGSHPRISTDNINFIPGIGVISHDYDLCKKAIGALSNMKEIGCSDIQNRKARVAVPKEGSVRLPNGKDMRRQLDKVVNEISGFVEIVEKDFKHIEDRHLAISTCEELFNEDIDMIITLEGPIDVYGTGDSVLGLFGQTGRDIQNNSGKYLLKVANMIDGTAITIPSDELGMGILIVGKKGVESGKLAIALGDRIRTLFPKPDLFERYFIEGYKEKDLGFWGWKGEDL